jgi:hypothetical protein
MLLTAKKFQDYYAEFIKSKQQLWRNGVEKTNRLVTGALNRVQNCAFSPAFHLFLRP